MTRITRFEDIESWKRAREIVKLIYHECQNGDLAKDFETKSQLKRASLSIMNNIAEGFARKSEKEFIRFLDYAVSSTAEVKSMTYVLEDVNYISAERINDYRERLDDIRNLILGLIRYVNSRPKALVKEENAEYGLSIEIISD